MAVKRSYLRRRWI